MLLSFRGLVDKYKMNIKGIIHIGAHIGQEIPDYIDMGVQNIILFEPLEENFKILSEKAQAMNANIIGHQAVSYTHLTLPTNREV